MCLVLLLALGNYLLKKKYFPLLKYKRLQKKKILLRKRKKNVTKKFKLWLVKE